MSTNIPVSDEYAPYYATYVGKVSTDNIVAYLEASKLHTLDFLHSIVWEKWQQSYAPDKWTLAEVVQHIIDCERVFTYRALHISRGDHTPIPGFNENKWAANADVMDRQPASIADEYAAVREASIQLFKNLSPEMWSQSGMANNQGVSVRALAWIIAGHEHHHLQVIRERYL